MNLLHPMLVHFPIVFFIFEPLLLVLALIRKNEGYLHFARMTFRLGCVFLFFSLLSGYADSGGWGNMSEGVSRHFYSALVLFISSVLKMIVDGFRPCFLGGFSRLLVWSLANAALVLTTAFFGGWIIYRI